MWIIDVISLYSNKVFSKFSQCFLIPNKSIKTILSLACTYISYT